jgi:glutathione synthase/RimK-type ligase-like ATP-grasp enzyme
VKRIAFVTCSDKPDFAPDDLKAIYVLLERGADVHAIPWDKDFSDWHTFDKVVLRSCWNYHLHPKKFLHWLDDLENKNIKLMNSIDVARWNLHKIYLQKLATQGVTLPTTIWLSKGSSLSIKELLHENRWEKAVVKPAISATAHKTFVTTLMDSSDHQVDFENLLYESDVLVQQFIPEIQQGEWSLIFFDKKFSHAVLKKPKTEDFRVQDDFGGTVETLQPSPEIVNKAEKILGLIQEPLLYARVDGVVADNQFLLMELELIEPVLFFGKCKEAPGRFADLLLH